MIMTEISGKSLLANKKGQHGQQVAHPTNLYGSLAIELL
jgi:hypothetical protein